MACYEVHTSPKELVDFTNRILWTCTTYHEQKQMLVSFLMILMHINYM